MVTDLVEIRRLGQTKAAENVAFRRYLTDHHDRIERFQALATDIQRRTDCTACANCCRYSTVAVTRSDIETIAGYLGESPDDVVRSYTDHDLDAPSGRALRSGREGCIFLDGNLCSIYEARPKGCRDFPHVAPGTHSLGGRLSSLCRWAPLCPIVYNAIEEYKHATGYHPSSGAHG